MAFVYGLFSKQSVYCTLYSVCIYSVYRLFLSSNLCEVVITIFSSLNLIRMLKRTYLVCSRCKFVFTVMWYELHSSIHLCINSFVPTIIHIIHEHIKCIEYKYIKYTHSLSLSICTSILQIYKSELIVCFRNLPGKYNYK